MGCAGSTGNKKNNKKTSGEAKERKETRSSPQRTSSTANSKSSQESARQEKRVDSEAAKAVAEALPLATHTGKVEDFYDNGKVLGSGAFSVVKEVFHKETGVARAAKCIPKRLVENEQSLLNLRREIKNLKALDHPNILKLFEVFEDEENFYLIMEKIEGSELFERIVEKGFYQEAAAAQITHQLLKAASYLHSIGIAHRDLKPENILITDEGQREVVKLADFGLSKNFGEAFMKTSCGSPTYVAPEVIASQEGYDNAVDMWAIGVILYALLVGYPPFDVEDRALFKKIVAGDYNFNGPNWDQVSDSAKEFVTHLMEVDPKRRYTADQALKDPWVIKHATEA